MLPYKSLAERIRLNLIVFWAAGLLCLLILLLIPRDADSARFFGYSAPRFGVIAAQTLGLAAVTALLWRAFRNAAWLESAGSILMKLRADELQTDAVLWLAGGGLAASVLFFYGLYRTGSPHLTRVSPLIVWLSVGSLQVLANAFGMASRGDPANRPRAQDTLRVRLIGMLVILGLAIGLRFYVLNTYPIPIEETRRQNIASNLALRRELAFCNSYFPFCQPGNDKTASVEPLPVVIYAAFLAFLNQPVFLAVLLQMSLGLGTIGVLYLLIRVMFVGYHRAILGALVWGLYSPLILEVEASLKGEAFFILFLALGMLSALLGMKKGSKVYWLLAGLSLGLAALSRSVILYFVPVLAIIYLALPGLKFNKRLVSTAIYLLAFFITLTPWVVRNYRVYQAIIPGVTLTGYNLYRHNHIIQEDGYLRYVYNPEMRAAQARLLVENDGILTGLENEYQMDQFYRREALKIIRDYPGRYLLLSLYRVIPLWTNTGVRYGYVSDLTWNLGAGFNLVLLILAAASVIRRRASRPHQILPIVALIFFFTVAHMMVNARMRFIMPVIPYVVAFAVDQTAIVLGKLGWIGWASAG